MKPSLAVSPSGGKGAQGPQSRAWFEGGAIVCRHGDAVHEVRIDELWLPPSQVHCRPRRLSDDPTQVAVCLALAEQAFVRSRDGNPDPRSVQKRIALYRNVLDFLQARSVYRLADASPTELDELVGLLAEGGWFGALNLTERWEAAARNLKDDEFSIAFRFLRSKIRTADSLNMNFWSERIGIGGKIALPASARSILEERLRCEFSPRWRSRKEEPPGAPGRDMLMMLICWLNDLHLIELDSDRLKFLPFPHPKTTVDRLAEAESNRTPNISLEDAVHLVESAFFWVYECVPLLTTLIAQSRNELELIPRRKRKAWLRNNPITLALQRLIGYPILQWAANQRAKRSDMTVDELVGCCQAASVLTIAFLNGRRSSEICEPILGLQSDDLCETNLEGIFETTFWIAKYRQHERFYITQASADAIRCVEELRRVAVPEGPQQRTKSIFWAARPTLDGVKEDTHFAACIDAKRTRSLSTFLDWAFPAGNCPQITMHTGRRMFALIYMYRYSHPRLRALSQHLRHLTLSTTSVYITDTQATKRDDQIKQKVGLAAVHDPDQRRQAVLARDVQDIARAIAEAGGEKMFDAVKGILAEDSVVGGFSKLVKHLYRTMSRSLTFERASVDEQIGHVRNRLLEHGYAAHPKAHGDCYLKADPGRLLPKCAVGGRPHPENADPALCAGCMYFLADHTFNGEIEAAEARWNRDRDDMNLPVMIQRHAEAAYQNIRRLRQSLASRRTT